MTGKANWICGRRSDEVTNLGGSVSLTFRAFFLKVKPLIGDVLGSQEGGTRAKDGP
jgi:hypothetical protein